MASAPCIICVLYSVKTGDIEENAQVSCSSLNNHKTGMICIGVLKNLKNDVITEGRKRDAEWVVFSTSEKLTTEFGIRTMLQTHSTTF